MAAPPLFRERLAFNYGSGTVPRAGEVDPSFAAPADGRPPVAAAPTAAVNASLAARLTKDRPYFLLLIFTAVLLLRPQDTIPALGALHLAELSALGAVATMVIQRLGRNQPLMKMTPEAAGLLVFGGAILLSVPFSIWPGGSFGLFTDSWIKLLIVFVLMSNTLTTPRRLEQITWLIVVSCGYISARSLWDYVRGINLVEGSRLGGAVGGIFGNPNDLAMNMVTFLPAAVTVALSPFVPGRRRTVALMASGFMISAIILTKSRGGAIGLVAMLLTLLLYGRRVRRGFAAMAMILVVAGVPFMPASFWERMGSIMSDEKDKAQFTGSREARSVVMKEGLQTFATYPLTGIGAGQFPNYNPEGRKERWRETHNALIQVAAETGAIGLAAFAFLIVRAFTASAATRKMLDRAGRSASGRQDVAMSDEERRIMQLLTVATTAGMAGWFVCSFFASIAYNWTFYYLLALIVAGREITRARLVAVPRGRA